MQLTNAQRKLIRSLHTRKGRRTSGLCLVEGQKAIDAAGDAVEYVFDPFDVDGTNMDFANLATTSTPQKVAAVARIPEWTREDVLARKTLVVLDGVQDPGNVGAILRLCLGFDASLVLIESADPSSPKVVRSSAGVLFHLPWITIPREGAEAWLQELGRPIVKMEAHGGEAVDLAEEKLVLIAGSEGQGIQLNLDAPSYTIAHNETLESLNVGHAVGIALAKRYQHRNG